MEISLSLENKNVVCFKNFDSKESGVISHFLMELKIAQKELIEIWEEVQK